MRSRGVNTSIIFQSIAQLKNRYPNDVYQEILGNCDTKLPNQDELIQLDNTKEIVILRGKKPLFR